VAASTRIVEHVPNEVWKKTLAKYSDDRIIAVSHALFRLSEKQRKVFKEENLKKILLEATPVFVGVQRNGRYAVFFEGNDKYYMRIVCELNVRNIEIVTFYNVTKETLRTIENEFKIP